MGGDIRISQNPGIAGLEALSPSELLTIQALDALGDPNANRILGWDDTDNTFKYFALGAGLSYDHSTHTLTATGSGSGVSSVASADGSITVTNPTTTVDLAVVKAPKWSTARNLAGNSVDGSANVTFSNKFIVQGTTDSGLSAAQFLGALATGIVKNTTTTGVLSIAASGTDYEVPLTFSTGLTRSTNTVTVNTSQNISTLSNLTSNGFVKTTGATGALSIDTNTYLTGNQSITLSGWAAGSGATSISTTTASKVILQGTTDSTATNAQFLGALATGIVKNTTTTGVLSIAAAGTDYQSPITLTTTGTSGAATFISNTLNIPQYTGGGGSGTVNSGTSGQMTYYASTGTAVSGNSTITYTNAGGTPALQIGTASGDQGSLLIHNSSAGVTTISPTTSASNFTLTLPAATDTLVGKATTDTLTNKTLTTPVINGTSTGTGVSATPTASIIAMWDASKNLSANAFIPGFTTTATAAGTTALTITSTQIQVFTGATTQTVTLPTTGVVAGAQYTIINNSTGLVTVQSSGANTITIVGASASATFTAVVATPTTAANWNSQYLGVVIASGKKLTVSNSITIAGTDTTTMTFPTTSKTIAANDGSNWTFGSQAIGDVVTASSTTAYTRIAAVALGSVLTSAGVTTQPTWSSAPQITTIELGNASDTTLSRSSAGVLAVEGVVIPSTSSTNTLSNKRITRRVVSTTQAAAPAINTDNTDVATITGLAQAITSFTTNLAGTPVATDFLEIQITDNGTARAITWGASFAATTVALPTTTVISVKLRVLFEWGGSTWDCVAVA